MKEEIISFETAKLAKEKGFNIDTFKYYRISINPEKKVAEPLSEDQTYFPNVKESIAAPTQSLLQKWLREEHGMLIYVKHFKQNWYEWVIQTNEIVECDGRIWGDDIISEQNESTYEQALEAGLEYALKLIK